MKITLNPDGSAQVSNADEGRENPDKSAALDVWNVSADQLSAHMRGMDAAHPWARTSAGDKSAAMDAINERRKQRAS